jgi:VIT1/CCC1 family predicted Fe2+/Mn2+ transporter
MYKILAQFETDPEKSEIFEQLSQSEIKHAQHWSKKLGNPIDNVTLHTYTPKLIYIRMVCYLFGPQKILPWLARIESKEIGAYVHEVEGQELVEEERNHARILSRMAMGNPDNQQIQEVWHTRGNGGSVRAAILGINDGLVSNFCLMMGVAGGTTASGNFDFIILAGVAALIAGSLSMATGEYISVRSQKDIYEHQIDMERAELEEWPEEEEEELVLIYRAKGIEESQARVIASALMADPTRALDTMVREELGLNLQNLGSPWLAAISSLLAFALGALIPIIPILFSSGNISIVLSAIFSASALFIVGGIVSAASGKNIFLGAIRMLLAGTLAAAFTYGAGYLLGISIF